VSISHASMKAGGTLYLVGYSPRGRCALGIQRRASQTVSFHDLIGITLARSRDALAGRVRRV